MSSRKTSLGKRIAVGLVSALLVFSASVTALPRPANALFGFSIVLDPADVAVNTAQTVIMKVLDGIAWAVAKAAIASMTQSVVNWINSGFHGSPAFVTNLDRNLQMVGDAKAEEFLNQLATDGAINSPFQAAVADAARMAYYQSTTGGSYFVQHPYTLGQVSSNPTAFYSGDFSQGGLNAWMSAWSHPQNNPYGASFLASQALQGQVGGAQSTRMTELNWAKGFLSWRGSCATPANQTLTNTSPVQQVSTTQPKLAPVSNSVPNVTVTYAGQGTRNLAAAAVLADNVSLTQNNPVVTPATQLNQTTGLQSTPGLTNSIPTGSINNMTMSQNTATSLSQTDNCLSYNINTPGSVIESQLENQLGTGIRQLELANSINEIVGTFVTHMVNQVLGGGGIAGLSQPSEGGGASYVTQVATNSTNLSNASTLSSGLIQTLIDQEAQVKDFESDWQAIKTVAQLAKTSCPGTTSTQADQVITQADAAITKSEAAIVALEKIKTEAQPSAATTDTASPLDQASSDYQSLLSGTVLPSPTEMTQAKINSQDSGPDATPKSLYTQMNDLAHTCPGGH